MISKSYPTKNKNGFLQEVLTVEIHFYFQRIVRLLFAQFVVVNDHAFIVD